MHKDLDVEKMAKSTIQKINKQIAHIRKFK